MIKKILSLIYWLFFIALLLIAGLYFFSNPRSNTKFSLYAVESGSMSPAIPQGSIVLVQQSPTYKKNDIINFRDPANPKKTTTHRITKVNDNKEPTKITYVTKGDANKTIDIEERSSGDVIGKVSYSLPFLGYIVLFAKTQIGFIIFIVIPVTLIVYTELINIKNEIAKMLKNRKKKND